MAIFSRITLHILLLCCYGPLFVHSALTVVPLNDAVMVGSTVELRCSAAAGPSNPRVMWTEFASLSDGRILSDGKEIIQSHPEADRFSIVGGELDFHLQIRNVRVGDGGRYMCQDIESGPPSTFRGYAELIVLNGHPQCQYFVSMVLEGTNYDTDCQVKYKGNIPPVMDWTGPGEFITNGSTTPDSVWAWMGFEAHSSTEGEVFKCLTKFPLIEADPGHANNTPTYTHTYTSPILQVRWGPRNMYAEPIKEKYTVGDVITCIADANPPVLSYQWTNVRTSEIFDGQNFTITQDMVGFNQTLRCRAMNFISYMWYFDNLVIPANVEGGPENVYAEPIKDEYTVGDVITCTAVANPLPFYQWLNTRTLEYFSCQNFTVTEDLIGFNQTMRCQALNVINGIVNTAYSFTPVYVPDVD